jgi:hypothetical protein
MGSFQSHFKVTELQEPLQHSWQSRGAGAIRQPPYSLPTFSPAQPWTTRMWDLTGFSYEDLMPCVLSLHKKWYVCMEVSPPTRLKSWGGLRGYSNTSKPLLLHVTASGIIQRIGLPTVNFMQEKSSGLTFQNHRTMLLFSHR